MDVPAAGARAPLADFTSEPVQWDDLRPDEILVRIVGVGLCHTDIVAQAGTIVPLPAVLGHEGSGVVEKVGAEVVKVAPGDRVAITFRSCGQCANCRKGLAPYCHSMPALNYTGARTDGSKAISAAGGEPLSSNFFGQSSFATLPIIYDSNVVTR